MQNVKTIIAISIAAFALTACQDKDKAPAVQASAPVVASAASSTVTVEAGKQAPLTEVTMPEWQHPVAECRDPASAAKFEMNSNAENPCFIPAQRDPLFDDKTIAPIQVAGTVGASWDAQMDAAMKKAGAQDYIDPREYNFSAWLPKQAEYTPDDKEFTKLIKGCTTNPSRVFTAQCQQVLFDVDNYNYSDWTPDAGAKIAKFSVAQQKKNREAREAKHAAKAAGMVTPKGQKERQNLEPNAYMKATFRMGNDGLMVGTFTAESEIDAVYALDVNDGKCLPVASEGDNVKLFTGTKKLVPGESFRVAFTKGCNLENLGNLRVDSAQGVGISKFH